MKFTKIRFIGRQEIDFPMIGALPSDLFVLKSADGLGPTEVDVFIAHTLNQGGVRQTRRPRLREVTLRVGLGTNYAQGFTPETLRETLYELLTPGLNDLITMQLLDGDDVAGQCHGDIKRIEPVLFTQTPEVQITMACTSAYFEAVADHVVDTTFLSTSNPYIENVGTAKTGFHIEFWFTSAQTNLNFTDSLINKRMHFFYEFQSGDKLVVDTQNGKRSIKVIRGGTTWEAIDSLQAGATWHQLHGGSTGFFLSPSSGWDYGPIYYRPQFLGV